MALEVGSVLGSLGARLDPDGFDRFDRRLDKARRDARDPVVAHASVKADTTGVDRYEKRLRDVDSQQGKVRKSSSGLGSALAGVGKTAAVVAGPAAFLALAGGAVAAFGAFKESEKVARQTEAVLKSTGGQAGVTAKQVSDLATAISRKTGVDDEQIQSGENLLLTFTNVRNEVGKGNDIFNQATSTITDMSAALGQDTKSSAIQLGKALNDPIKGITALSRVGVSFTAQQKEQITTLVKSGDTLSAQKLILGELNKEFGGSAEATATNGARLKVTLGNVAETIGGALSPAIEGAAGTLNTFIQGMTDGTGAGGRFANGARQAADVVGGAWRFLVGIVRGGARVIGDVIGDNRKSLDSIGHSAGELVGAVRGAFGAIVSTFRDTFGGSSGASGDVRNIVEKLLGLEAIIAKVYTAIVKRALPGIVTAFRGLALILRGVIRVISGILSGDFGKAWDGVKDIFRGAVKYLAGIIRAGTAPIRAGAAAIGKAVSGPLSSAWQGILGTARGFVNGIISVLNLIPGVHIKKVGGGKGIDLTGIENAGSEQAPGGRRTVQAARSGGKVTAPIVIMGEEAPEHPEWVIPTNPAYRSRAIGLWQLAGRELGVPGFRRGGRVDHGELAGRQNADGTVGYLFGGLNPGKALKFVESLPGKAAETAAGLAGKIVGKLPGNPGGMIRGAYSYALDKAKDFIGDKAGDLFAAAKSAVTSVAGGGGAGTGGLVPQVLRALAWARAHGWHGSVNSGYRSPADQIRVGTQYAASLGKSVAQVYPNGLLASSHVKGQAVDVSDPAGFARAMRGAPRDSYIFNAIPWDPVHFSVTGHRRGGLIGGLGSIGGELLAGGRLAFKKGGKTPKPTLSASENAGIRRSVARGERGIVSFESDIQARERRYGQADRRFGLSDEVLLIENADGSTTVDESAVAKRVGELDELVRQRQNIEAVIKRYRAKITALIKRYRDAIATLKTALGQAKGKARQKERGGYREAIKTYNDRIGELQGTFQDLGGDLVDQRIDLAELYGERETVKGTKGQAAPPPDAADTPAADDGSSSSSPDTPATTPPTPLEIATAAAEAFSAFTENRADLFAGFGSNFLAAGAGRPGSPLGQAIANASGTRFLGAGTTGEAGAGAAAGFNGDQVGERTINIVNNFEAPPPDPHTWTQQTAFELAAAG